MWPLLVNFRTHLPGSEWPVTQASSGLGAQHATSTGQHTAYPAPCLQGQTAGRAGRTFSRVPCPCPPTAQDAGRTVICRQQMGVTLSHREPGRRPPVGPRHSAHLRLAPAGPQPQSLHGGPAVPASAPCPSCSAWAPLGARACLPGADVGPGGGMGSPGVSSDDVLTGAGPGGGREGGSVCAGVGPVAGPLGRRCRDWRPSVSGR